ncbi:MAG: LapA family protein [Bacteroidales bacterium]|nr:LapA family protein [Bacteroidales bacterium]MDD4673790.1 LapA family protein [Bacteroidales bacterium]MDY0349219.1 LapA family protein [Tenuifilaceae bacterium]
MKALKISALLLLFALVLTFAYQNLEKVDVTFISWSITVPFSLTILLSFIIGVLTGSLALCFVGKKKKKDKVEQLENKSDKTDNLS